jgi:hypothetical protein
MHHERGITGVKKESQISAGTKVANDEGGVSEKPAGMKASNCIWNNLVEVRGGAPPSAPRPGNLRAQRDVVRIGWGVGREMVLSQTVFQD